jgi:hypothetical protein
MSELNEEVRRRLANLNLNASERDEVIAEITGHLEHIAVEMGFDISVQDGATSQVLAAVKDWPKLGKQIEKSKEREMKDRLRKIWLPALGTGFVAYAAQNIIAHLVTWPRVVRFHDSYLVYSWQWLLVLLFTGALGAYWSRMMGGTFRDRLIVALAPSEIMGAFVLVMLPISLCLDWAVGSQIPYALTHPTVVVAMLSWMVVLPAVPSMLGAAWFLRGRRIDNYGDRNLQLS